MTTLPIYQIDAFADQVFAGNPAAVIPMDNWLDDALMQHIAQENNLSETAFLVPEPEGSEADFHIRWFTPTVEVPLCGHATLASAWVLFHQLEWPDEIVRFRSRSGLLSVRKRPDGWLQLDFPRLAITAAATPALLSEALPDAPDRCYHVTDDTNYLVVLDTEAQVRTAQPDMQALKRLGNQGVIVTAPGTDCDFVSRYFAPGSGIEEDPVTGSIHAALTPYWAGVFQRDELIAHQLSERGGVLACSLQGDRVRIAGQGVFYMSGHIQV